ncbi:DUF4781 domain-containing protein [Billgrantia bachuensis]|uniref:DUF4781 domain-containing protein n=1 Tax=Billgrantia bachuensis TaxID=2717286 RepID=A0ABX0PNB7_9GAMM|nr:DUF4781 domain-containing protein [Halomonas bachuensis]NIC04777.1 DUF4781 domain-containing protein [Halomonas bachuensis]
MVRLSSIFRLAARASTGSESIFAKAIIRAAAKPRPPSPPTFTPQQTVTPTVPQWNGGTAFQPINTSHTPMVGYGVYSPEYLQQMELSSEPLVYGPTVPENFDSPSFDPLNFDPQNQNDIFLPVDNASEQEPVFDEEAVEQAQGLAEEITEGKGLDLFEESELNREEIIEQLEAGGYEVESAEWGLAGDNITRTTITDPETGETIHEYYDHDTDRYWVEVTGEDGETLSQSPVRDDEGRKVTVSEDEESGERTTRLEDDLGDGSVVEITELPDSDVVTITTTDSDGNSETVVMAEDGTRTTLDPEQVTSREGIDEIAEGVANGQSIEEIAEEQGLTREQVIAQLAAAGYEVESGVEGQGPNYTDTTRITDAGSGDLVVSHETGPDGTQTSLIIDTDGNEIRRTEDPDGSTTDAITEPDGRVTETRVDADGTTTTTVTYEQNGVVVEEVSVDDGETTTTIIDDDGNRTELDSEQDTSREGIDEIAEAVSEGKSIDSIAEEMGLDPAQIIAQLAAAGFGVSEYTEPDDSVTRRIVDADSGEEIARYRFTMGEVTQSTFFVDAQGNEERRTEYRDGRSTETVEEANGRRTVTRESADGEKTVSVTHNGYTVTTPPDGDITVRREEDGTEVEVEKGTPLEAMVEVLMAVDLDSSDAEEARAAEVVLAAVERALAGETFQELYGSDGTDGAVAEQQKALDEAIEEYCPGQQPDRNVTYENPYGDPPLEPPPSGGDWVPMDGLWLDPEVAKATAALKVLEAEQLKAFAEFERSQDQLDVFAVDPAYEEALQRAGNLFDEALAPQGLVWVRPEPEGTLEEARARLEGAEIRQEAAGEAMEEYQEAERLLDEAISAQGEMPDPPNGYVCTSDDTPADLQQKADQYEQEQSAYEAAQADLNVLFSDVRLHSAKGDSHLPDYEVSQLEDMLAETDPDSDAYERIEEELRQARSRQEGAGIQVDTAQAYYDFHSARRDNLQLTVEAYDMREQLLEAFNEDKGLLEEGKKFNTIGGDYLGEFTGQQVIEEREDGLWVVTHFEEGTTEERLAPEEMSEWWENHRDPELTETWLELGETRQTAHDRERETGTDLHRALERNYGFALESLDEQLSDLEAELESLFKTHGQGTEEAPDELFSGDVEPQEIELGGQVLWVTPDLAAAFEEQEQNLDVLKSSDQPIGIMIDGERRWVHAEIAITHVAFEIARDETQREILETARDEVSNTADRYELGTEQSMPLLGESDADYEARVEYDVVEAQGGEALDTLFQSRFQEFHAQGFDATFNVLDEDGVADFVETNLGLTEGREGYDDVLDAIHEVGGEWPAIRAVPLLHLDREGGRSEIVLLAVRGDDGEVRYVDGTGRHYADLADFQDHNRLFGEEGRLVVPKDLEMRPSEGGVIPLEVVTARNVSVQEKIVDPLIGIGTGVATVLSFTPAAPVAAPLAFLGSGYLGYRAFEHQRNHMQRGGDWNDWESGLNYFSIATAVLPVKASGFRMVGMARDSTLSVTKGEAFLASIGAVKPGSTLAANAHAYMRSADAWNRVARGADWGAIVTGFPLMGYSGYQLAVNGDQMTGLQQIDAVLGLSTGFVGTGLGIYGLRTTRPQRGNGSNPPAEPGGQPPAGRGGDTPPPTSDLDAPNAPGSTTYRPDVNETEGGRNTPAPDEPGNGIPSAETAHDTPVLPDPALRDEASQTVTTAIEGRAQQAALFDTQVEATPSTTRRDYFDSGASTPSAREAITFRLQDEQGRPIEARVLGPRAPSSVDNVYIQPAIGPRLRGDEPGVRGKTHIFYRDPETGEAFVMPWMRGASQNHVASAQQTATPPQGLARLYRLVDLDALNQASTEGTLPPGHYVHIIRSSNTGLDNATFVIDGGTVPKSGRIDENGHIRWPSSQKGQPVTLTLHDQGNGQQAVRVVDNIGSEAPREVTAKHGDVYVVVTSDRATETRAQIQGGGLSFAAYSGNGLWSVSSTVSTSQSSTTAPNAALTAQQQGTTPSQATPATQQNAASSSSPLVSGRVSVTTDSQGPIVRIHDLGGNWTPVTGQSTRKIGRSPYDRNVSNEVTPETTLVRRSVLEQALAPEDAAKLPNVPYVRVSLMAGPQEGGHVYTTPVHATSNDSSPARRRTARGLAAALVGGSMFGMHSASAHGWTGDVLNRAAAPASPAHLLNGLGFVTRGSMILFKSRFDEKIRINREALERGEVTAERLNWEASRIIASRRALNLSKEQVARVGTVTEEFWARYQLLQNLSVTQESRQRGWTEEAKTQALTQASSLYRTQLKKVAGPEALTVNPLDPRTWKGVLFNSSILATHLVNDVVSWQYIQNKISDGEFLKISNNLLDFTGDVGIAGFLAANVVLAGSAATRVATGLTRVDLAALPYVKKLAGTGTAVGSYFYGIMTPPWAAYTMYAAGEAMANGHWYSAGVNLAALPFQVALSYYGIRGLRDDTVSMVKSWKNGQDPGRSWPIRLLYPMTTIPMAALTGTEAYNQFAQGNHIAGTALAGGTLMQAYFIDLASRRLNWTDADVRHGPFRRLAGENRLAADENRIWAGVGLTLAGGMLIPGALIDLRNYLEDKDLLPDWEWLVADLESEEKSNETPVDLTDYLRNNELLPGWVWRRTDFEGKKEVIEAPDTKVSLGRVEQEGGSPSLEPTPRANPALEEQGHDWVEAASHLSLGGIAIKRGYDIAELVELNLSHIDDPTVLRPGDRIYLPKRELV